MARLAAAHVAVALLLMAALAAADLEISCDSGWTKYNQQVEGGVEAPLSGCQMSMMNVSTNNYNALGGSGEGDIWGIPAGSGGGGLCDEGSECAKYCQAICCFIPGCTIAKIWNDKDSSSTWYGGTTTMRTFYCSTFSSRTGKHNANYYAFCEMPAPMKTTNSNDCPNLALKYFGMDNATYINMRNAAAYSTCPSSGRKLQQQTGQHQIGQLGNTKMGFTKEQLVAQINGNLAKFTLPANLTIGQLQKAASNFTCNVAAAGPKAKKQVQAKLQVAIKQCQKAPGTPPAP